jgi:hypothetical protein
MESRAPRVQSHGSGQTTPPDTGAIAVSNHEVRAPRTAWPRRTLGLHLADPCDSIVTQYLTRFAGTMWRRIANMQVTAFLVTWCDALNALCRIPPTGRLTVT